SVLLAYCSCAPLFPGVARLGDYTAYSAACAPGGFLSVRENFAGAPRKFVAPERHNVWMRTRDLDWLAAGVGERAAGLRLFARQWVDAATAEDVVQEALVALLAERQAPRSPVAWMYRAVRNAAFDHHRSSMRRRRREQAVAGAREQWFESRTD